MRGALAVFVKTPGFSPVKTRLADTLGTQSAELFYRKSLCAIEAVAIETKRISEGLICPYWAVGEAQTLGHLLWKNFASLYTGPGGLGHRMHHVYSQLLQNYDFVILIGSDSPQISPGLIVEAAEVIIETGQFVMGPARDGGFYLLGGSHPIGIEHFTSVPYSCANTASNMINELEKTGNVKRINQLTDVDTVGDFELLLDELKKCMLPEQKELWAWLQQHDLFSDQN